VVHARVDRLGIDEPWLRTEIVRLDPRDWKNPETAKIVDEYSKELAPKTQVVVVELGKPISRESNDAGESKMGRLIAEAQRNMVGVEIALMNSGGVRGDLYTGPVTWQELYHVQPFGNTLVKATLTGKELRQALEQGISPTSTSVQVAGINVLIDRSRSFGQRVRELLLEDGTAVEPDGEYAVVFNNFIGSGGDSFTVLRDCETKTDTGILDLDALIEYLHGFPEPVELEIEERMSISD